MNTMSSSPPPTSNATVIFSADRVRPEHGETPLFRKVRRLAGEALTGYRMLEEGDRVLLALSGGRDSLVMLEVLAHFRACAPISFALGAVTFDPGFPEFNAAAVGAYCRSLGVPHRVESLDIPTVLAAHSDCGRKRRPCVLCSRLRRGRLYRFARAKGFNKLALGHHLDDILISFLISLWRGQGLSTMAPKVAADTAFGEGAAEELTIIRPLALAPESLVKGAAAEFAFPEAGVCPYHEELATGDRAWAARRIAEWEKRIPNIRQNMLRSLSDLRPGWLLDKRFLP